jgi:hypothetical protein
MSGGTMQTGIASPGKVCPAMARLEVIDRATEGVLNAARCGIRPRTWSVPTASMT